MSETLADLFPAWSEIVRRRTGFGAPLAHYEPLLASWRTLAAASFPTLAWGADECRTCWGAGHPLLSRQLPPVPREQVEDCLAPVLEIVAGAHPGAEGALTRLAEAWDRGTVRLEDLLPGPGRLGDPRLAPRMEAAPTLLALVGGLALRPLLEAYLLPARIHLASASWRLGVCPFCGAPPVWSDVLESGVRELACGWCGGSWPFPRVACPACGGDAARDLVRLQTEGVEEGYSVQACRRCQGYLKELDRRARWNGGPPTLEDWASPHLDVVARRAGYWRPVPTLLDPDPVRESPP